MHKPLFWLTLLVLGAFALRAHQLGHTPLRGDEAFSAQYWAQLPLSESLARIATIEPHPPLTYALFHLWGRIFGIYSEFALRMLPVLGNLLGVPLLYQLGRRLHSKRVGVFAALLWTIHPFEVWHAQDFRNYALWASSSAFLGMLAVRYWHAPKPRHLWQYGAWAVVSALIFYFELLIIAGLGLAGLLFLRRRAALAWLATNAAAGASVLAVFITLQGRLFSSGGYAGNTSAFAPAEWVTQFLPVLTFGDSLPPAWFAPLGLLLAALYTGMLWAMPARKTALLLLAWGALPLLLLGFVSLRVSVFIPRYAMAVIPAFVLLVALFVRQARLSLLLRTAVATFWIGMSAFGLYNYYHAFPASKSPDWHAVRDFVREHVLAGDYVLQSAPESAFAYYLYMAAGEQIANGALPVSPNFPPNAEMQALLEEITAGYARVWYFVHTEWQNTAVVRDWLAARAARVETWRVMGHDVLLYHMAQTSSPSQ